MFDLKNKMVFERDEARFRVQQLEARVKALEAENAELRQAVTRLRGESWDTWTEQITEGPLL